MRYCNITHVRISQAICLEIFLSRRLTFGDPCLSRYIVTHFYVYKQCTRYTVPTNIGWEGPTYTRLEDSPYVTSLLVDNTNQFPLEPNLM